MIAEEALKDANSVTNEAWKMSLMNLFHAANVMDAFVARSTGPQVSLAENSDNDGDMPATPA